MSKISAVINTFNEAKNLPRAIASVKALADEIVVCDMESTDSTPEIAKKLGARVIKHKKTGYVEPARNYAISKAIGDWILVLDADEEISSDLRFELRKIIKKPKADYYRLPRKNIIFGKWMKHSRWWPDYNIRFFKKGNVLWNEIIHSVPVTEGVGADLEAKEEKAIVHHHYNSIEQYIERMNIYTSVQSDLKLKEGYKFDYLDLIKRPSNEFLSRFFAGQGYKDGLHGFSVSLLQAFSEIVLYLKIWQKQGFKDGFINVSDLKVEVKKTRLDFNYWFANTNFNETGNFFELIKRKFKIF